MDGITALGQEYLKRKNLFQTFAQGFIQWAKDNCPSFDEANVSEAEVTFRFLGRRLSIRHSFNVEGHPEILTATGPDMRVRVLGSHLEMLEVQDPPKPDTMLADSSSFDWEGRSAGIPPKPERVFQELVKVWMERTKTDTEK